jgi:pimeloyl-ACP methyl ester carboxylesterase
MLAMAKEWAKGMVHPARRDEGDFMDAIHQMIARAPVAMYEAQIAALLSRPSRSPLLTTIAVPTMVLCGHEDAWSPVARHREMADKIPGSVFVDVADCGHMSTLEKPEAINAAMLNWLKTPHT